MLQRWQVARRTVGGQPRLPSCRAAVLEIRTAQSSVQQCLACSCMELRWLEAHTGVGYTPISRITITIVATGDISSPDGNHCKKARCTISHTSWTPTPTEKI
eukprot:jgi/Ulvmu1/474/UM001_0482.1